MLNNTLNINAKSVLKYTLLPGILPRAKELGTSGFGYLAFLFACVYQTVRILPANHPFVNPKNIGTFSIVQVIAAAANNVQVNRRNIDQIVVFAALLVAVILMFLQFILLILALVTGKAFAQTGSNGAFTSIFLTKNPQTDIAFLMLDYVFGIPAIGGAGGESFFGSNALQSSSGNVAGGPSPFQLGMHALFNFYNLAILLVAVLIFMYYIFVVVIETAKTGVPFGQRFSKLYAPFRLVFAIGLLVPLYSGFNGAQYITLTAAKLGSSFATNGWILYNKTLQNPMGVETASLVAKPTAPSIDGLMYFASVYHACREIYAIWQPKDFKDPQKGGTCIKAYVLVDGVAKEFVENTSTACGSSGSSSTVTENPRTSGGGSSSGTFTYEDAKKQFDKSDMQIILGELDTTKHKAYAGSVRPYCGEMTISLANDNPAIYTNKSSGSANSASSTTGIRSIESMYFGTVKQLLGNASLSDGTSTNVFAAMGERAAHGLVPSSAESVHDTCHKQSALEDGETCKKNWEPKASVFQRPLSNYRNSHEVIIQSTFETFRKGLDIKLNAELENRGWGGAGIWYNNIADLNGSFTGAVYAVPSVRKFPEVMESVKKQKQAANKTAGICEIFTPNLTGDQAVTFGDPKDRDMAIVMNGAYTYFNCYNANRNPNAGKATGNGSNTPTPDQTDAAAPNANFTPNVFMQAIGLVFGINGLYDMRANSQINSATGQTRVHPLAQLSTVGKSLVENAMRSMAMAVGAAFGGGILGALSPHLGAALNSASSMFVSIATIGLSVGFILFYILPFLPFIYFFFAVGNWVKSIFEAMVGVPLWALAHLRIDGDGFSGQAAKGGYFLILEIFLRPIVTLFGLIGGIAVFGAMAAVLNNIFDLVLLNVTGSIPGEETGSTVGAGALLSFRRGVIDQFFFTIMYAILIYMMATASFKMIDTIPKQFMRWLGTGVSTFNDNSGDPTQNLTRYAALGGAGVSEKVFQGVQGGASTLGGAGGALIKSLSEEEKK